MIYSNEGANYGERIRGYEYDNRVRNFQYNNNHYIVTRDDGNTVDNSFPLVITAKKSSNRDKFFKSRPDKQLQAGDFIEFKGDTYIVTSYNLTDGVYQYGALSYCNDELKWEDGNGNVNTVNANIDWQTIDITEDEEIITQQGDIQVLFQSNGISDNISENQRFLINNNAYQVIYINKNLDDNLTSINLEITEKTPYDDFDTGIAYNTYDTSNPSTEPSTEPDTEYILSNNELVVSQYLTVEFSAYKYVSGVKQATTFTFDITGVDSSYYELTIIDGNNITVKGLKQNANGTLNITDNDTGEVTTVPVEFKGMF